jgi:ubiquinone/menaquinone biosynthesis C-methylase UbiE
MNPPPNFNRLARLYRWMELATFGPYLVKTRCAFLAQANAATNALVLGDGDGRFTASLLRTNPGLRIDAVDASASMLQSLLRRAGLNAIRVRTHHADARALNPPSPPYDLIVTHFFLDCLTTGEIQSLSATLRTAVSPKALWLISEFAVPATLFGRLIAAPVVHSLYRAFGLFTGLAVRALPDHRTALRNSGFVLQTHRTHLAGLLVSELWTLS